MLRTEGCDASEPAQVHVHSLHSVVLHKMTHVLGIDTLWSNLGLLYSVGH
jgi:hypothetical protein